MSESDAASESDDGPPTVLVMEDEEELRRTYELWLAGDYDVLTAAEGEEALELAGQGVDVVLLDRMMPGLSGKETLAELRDRGIGAKYAMVTAVEPDFDIIEMGFDAYLTKPVDEDRLRVRGCPPEHRRGGRTHRPRGLMSERATDAAPHALGRRSPSPRPPTTGSPWSTPPARPRGRMRSAPPAT